MIRYSITRVINIPPVKGVNEYLNKQQTSFNMLAKVIDDMKPKNMLDLEIRNMLLDTLHKMHEEMERTEMIFNMTHIIILN